MRFRMLEYTGNTEYIRKNNMATATCSIDSHEIVHQLLFNTRLYVVMVVISSNSFVLKYGNTVYIAEK